MAILVKTHDKQLLMDKIKKYIGEGKNPSWRMDEDGDFYLSNDKIVHFWIRPRLTDSEGSYNLVFGVLGNAKELTTTYVYAIAHSRFTELLLTGFDVEIESIKLSSFAMRYDELTYTLSKK